ncbi:MAG: hypothetical protein AW06_001532 [Candidatus Accumulibacter cognatus]|uniref:Uncharacterized protein n=1 Tax=Candidatus Accumulibacter cognatus TaxID=2954383 RepID=A0A080M8J0_9PROT|nr:MAG: hypothetical protein AW06_001532 [Candidatus Accumulibacter cognatus]
MHSCWRSQPWLMGEWLQSVTFDPAEIATVSDDATLVAGSPVLQSVGRNRPAGEVALDQMETHVAADLRFLFELDAFGQRH